jgi:predicted Zn-dependent protease
MKKIVISFYSCLGFLAISSASFAQENNTLDKEDSAELFLEDYTDTFQEKFFEALKQKSIENYDKEINLLLECKKIDKSNNVIDYELAKAYKETKQYDLAELYAINTVNSEPENYWYLNTLVSILNSKRSGISAIKDLLPENNLIFNQNLALIYYNTTNYLASINVLNTLEKSKFTDNLNSKLKIGLKEEEEENTQSFSYSTTINNTNSSSENDENATIETYKNRILGLLRSKSYILLDQISKDALENYPAQPYFYYSRGVALNHRNKPREAIKVLEESLDYMLDDIKLSNKIYQELVDAYTATHNPVKASIYKRKIKPGF